MQKIYYGAPGTGKSHEIDQLLTTSNTKEENIFRITFHPEFTYSDFIGQLLPTVVKNGTNKGDITYTFHKGVFTKALEKSYLDTSVDVYLIIEEMSRGNISAILGDIFQLLDREDNGIRRGYSKYFVNNEVLSKDIVALKDDRVYLPPNLHIFGSVNTSDQNLFVMDTAFKRRFDWEYISTKPQKDANQNYINNGEFELYKNSNTIKVNWIDFYQSLNEFITDKKYLSLSEDKQIGQFFLKFTDVHDVLANKEVIKNKLLHYLWEDIHLISYRPDIKLFNEDVKNFGDLYVKFDQGDEIFSLEFLNIL